MAATIDTRDLRGANKAWKRNKDNAAKWAFGSRPLAGRGQNWLDYPLTEEVKKVRPIGKHSDAGFRQFKGHSNTNKVAQASWQQKNGRPKGKFGGREEISDVSRSVADLLVPASRRESIAAMSVGDVLYSFDRTDSPGRPLTLDVFVKAPDGALATERLVESEYEILDTNGESLKGRKARRTLRKSGSAPIVEARPSPLDDDEGFELL